MNFGQFNDFLNECIIAAKGIGDRTVLFKNRDRGYYPKNKIVQEIIDGVEVAYIQDIDSGWKEGLNEFGIAVINSRLSASKEQKREPKEQYKIIPYSEKKLKALKSEKESIVIDILSKTKNLVDAVAMAKEKGLMGLTFISDGQKTIEIENTEDYGFKSREWEPVDQSSVDGKSLILVRTNHGILFPDAGYQPYPGSTERHSSEARKAEAEKFLDTEIHDPLQIFDLLGQQPFDTKSEMNVFRTSQIHFTGGQLLIDPKYKVLTFAHCGETVFQGIDCGIENPSIRVYVYDKSDSSKRLWDSDRTAAPIPEFQSTNLNK